MSDIVDRIAAVLREHEMWRSWGITAEGVWCPGCERRYQESEYPAHVAERVAAELHLDADPILNVSITDCPWCDENGLIDEGAEGLRGCKNHRRKVWRGWSDVEEKPVTEGDRVRIVSGDVPPWVIGQTGEIRAFNGAKYQTLIRNQADFPWYVYLLPENLERL